MTPKPPLAPNPGKSCCTQLDGETWTRIPIHTEAFTRDTPLEEAVARYVANYALAAHSTGEFSFDRPWFTVVSEKVVAITQGRSFPVDAIRVSLWARVLSGFVVRTPHGIGLGHPATMQLAIEEAGLPRILAAAAASVVGKAVGRRGWFYRVAGHGVDQIDGPTPNSLPPSDTSAKAPVVGPGIVARQLGQAIRDRLVVSNAYAGRQMSMLHAGVVVLDASDLGCQPLGWETRWARDVACRLFADNPLGQDRQQTPIAIVVRVDSPLDPLRSTRRGQRADGFLVDDPLRGSERP